jgi:hypothetical protein
MPQQSSNPARIDFGCGYYTGLHRTPRVLPAAEPGHVTLILGQLCSGHPVLIDITELEWLDQLESAVQAARAEGVVEAGMTLPASAAAAS